MTKHSLLFGFQKSRKKFFHDLFSNPGPWKHPKESWLRIMISWIGWPWLSTAIPQQWFCLEPNFMYWKYMQWRIAKEIFQDSQELATENQNPVSNLWWQAGQSISPKLASEFCFDLLSTNSTKRSNTLNLLATAHQLFHHVWAFCGVSA